MSVINRGAAASRLDEVAAAGLDHESALAEASVVRSAIEKVEAERLRHMVSGDLDGIAQLCDQRLDYVHSTGRRDTLASLLELLGSGAVSYSGITHQFTRIENLGAAVWAAGSMQINLVKEGQAKQLHTLTTTLWLRHHNSYRLLSFHATTAPAAM